jgi:transcriptional regulator with PAS, ATPase and Fis domain
MTESDIISIKQRFGIIGNSPLLNNAIRVAAQVAPTDMNVLIFGESGTGKESFSKIIHQLSSRRHNTFIAVNCGAIPEGTIDSELFGHEKGSFTGAVESRKGFFEVTDGGTIFLDEIGEMPLGTQARLLRVLENGEFIKVGSNKAQRTNVRVVAATNINLLQAIERKKFREDLYFRLSTVPIQVPALRERGNDIVLLFRKFASDFSERYQSQALQLSPDATALLLKHPFPGNIRQLKNLVEQLSVILDHRLITAEILHQYLPENRKNTLPMHLGSNEDQNITEREILYKILFEMRRDVTELKKLVLQLIQNGNFGDELINNHQDLFRNVETEHENKFGTDLQPSKVFLPQPNNGIDREEIQNTSPKDKIIEIKEVAHDTFAVETNGNESDNLSIEEKEKELILKALKKNKNRRKQAALDLGISERTLYRKIKSYDLEED